MSFKPGNLPWNKGMKGVRFGGHNGLPLKNNPNWKNGSTITVQGYRLITIESKKRVLEHRYLMEQSLGRKLGIKEHVHHINGNKLDNRMENLQLLDASTHSRITANKRWRLV